jgi:hypothetical protein
MHEFFSIRSRPRKELVSWMRDPGDRTKAVTLSLSQKRQARPNGVSEEQWPRGAEEAFFREVADSPGKENKFVAAYVDIAVLSNEPKIVGSGASLDRYIQSLTLNAGTNFILSDVSIKDLFLTQHGLSVELINCNVRDLYANSMAAEVRLIHSNVGTLHINSGALKRYEMRAGSLLNVDCPPPGANNPFTGTVSFAPDVFFPRKRNAYILPGPQPYRNMRYHLRSLENAQMANLIHSAELAVERADDTLTNKVVSHVYEVMSDFGSSVLRPFLWMVLLYVASVCAILFSDGAALASKPIGWQRILVDPTCGEYARAFYLALQPVVNPIGILGPRSLLVPQYAPLAAWLSVQGFLGLILLALLIFAIRRRFKIQT